MSIDNSNLERPASTLISELLDEQPIKAASFIVTVYGDVVEPRGGVVWIGNLIEVCGEVGISETLVRTAVSRLVAAGQLHGERSGKRSFYRLTPAAKIEFSLATRQLFSPETEGEWRFVYLAGDHIDEEMRHWERNGYARVTPSMVVGCRPVRPVSGANITSFEAKIDRGAENLRAFANEYFHLGPLSAAYRSFIERYSRLEKLRFFSRDALALRLLLVHDFRFTVLRDPNLSSTALPQDWPGATARKLFSALYREWSTEADTRVGLSFVNANGRLAAHTDATLNRLKQLHRDLS